MKLILFLLFTGVGFAAKPLTTLDGCKLVPTEWADGDSFRVLTKDGTQHTVRLYGADCIESQTSSESDARRLRAQRRYFGISGFGGSAQKSIEAAKQQGALAGKRTAELLAEPFTVHTSFSDARGDGRYKRIYGFITTSAGQDLASQLVKEGLARAYGVSRETPTGSAGNDYREQLRDLELQAAQKAAGVWKLTDWEQLPSERNLERREEAELSLTLGKGKRPDPASINPNTAARDELMDLPGVGEVTANRIIEGRPYTAPKDLIRVSGIGEKTLAAIEPFLKIR